MGTPKRKTSKSRIRTRVHAQKKKLMGVQNCPKCGAPQRPHRVCPSCGTYNGRQVLIVSTDE